ncbi:MAG: hypothetical protein GY765_24635 [bacterium]|nr:hypothetical protein [bacterium]
MFKRIGKIFKGLAGIFVSDLEKANPRALIEVEKENLKKQLVRYNENLVTHAGFIERLKRQIKDLEKKEKETAARISANINVGDRATAGQLALSLQTVKSQLDENLEQMVTAEETYTQMTNARDASLKEAKEKIESLTRMITETEMMEAQVELQEMASGMMTEIGGTTDTLDRVENHLLERRDKAAGRSRLATGNVPVEKQLKEAERQALAELALAEFETSYGLPAGEEPALKPGESPQDEAKKLKPPSSGQDD